MATKWGGTVGQMLGWLAACTMLAGCSGALWHTRLQGPAGVSITYRETLFRDIERILQRCADPLDLPPGLDRLNGMNTLLVDCRIQGAAIDFERITQATSAQRADRLRALATVIGLIDQPIDPPVPAQLDDVTFGPSNPAELIPILGDAVRVLNNGALSTLMSGAQAVLKLPGAPCRFEGRAIVDLTRLRLRNVAFAWRRTGLRMTAEIDDGAAQARAQITTAIRCLGSTDNPAHAVLKAVLPDGTRTVRLRDVRLEMDFAFAVELPDSEDPRLRVTRDRVALTVDRMRLGSSGNATLDSVSDDALRKLGFNAAKVAAVGSRALRPVANGIAAALGPLILDSLDLEHEASLQLKLAGVEFEEDRRGVNRRMRFETLRTDQLCFLRPGGRIVDGKFVPGEAVWVCTDPFGTAKPECQKVRGTEICWRPPVGPGRR